jgi:hypothetical protein
MTDWVTISGLATAGGTLALAGATYGAVRSSNRSARVAELALAQQLRPVLVQSQIDDPDQKIMFHGGHWIRAAGGEAVVEHMDGVVYLGMSLRNVGSGIGVLIGWYPWPNFDDSREPHAAPEQFRVQSRDLLIPADGIGLWQGALRDDSEELHGAIARAAAEREGILIDLLYADHMGGQRSITRFAITPVGEERRWLCGAARHWQLDDAAA